MRLSLMLLSAVLAFPLASARAESPSPLTPQPGFAGQFLIAQAAERKNDWPSASRALDALAQLDANNSDLSHQHMLLLLNDGRFDEALSLAKSYPVGSGQPHLAFLLQLGAAARTENAPELARLQATLDEGSIARFLKPFFGAWLAAKEGNFTLVTTELEKVEPIGQLRQAASFHKALIAEQLGQPDVARTIFSRLLIELPDTRTILAAHNFYAQRNLPMQQAGLARAARRAGVDPILQVYLETTPKTERTRLTLANGIAQVLYDLASLLYSEGASDLALPYLRVAQALRPADGDITLMLAELLGQLGQIEAAQALLTPLTARSDLGGLATLRLALLELDRRAYSSAKQQLDDMVQRYPGWTSAKSLLGDIAARQRDNESAINYYTAALESLPDDAAPKLRAQLLQARAQTRQHTNSLSLVETDLTAALTLQPDSPQLLNHLGYLMAEQGIRLEQAEAMLRKALEQNPDDVAILDSLGWTLHRQGKTTEAVRWLELASELSPYDDTINDHLGDAYWAAGRQREARFQWQRAMTYHQADAPLAVSLDDLRRKLEQGPALRVSAERQ
jgi:predicted Zn-dependent protease